MILRDQAPGDAAGVRRAVAAAFGGTAEADLVEALRDSGDAVVCLVAEDGDGIVGHVLFSRLRAPELCLALAPLSVVPGRQGRGVGTKLATAGLGRAREAGWHAVFVLGEPGYYERFGFRAAAAAPFETAYPKDYLLALELAPGALAGRSGALVYPPPFLALG